MILSHAAVAEIENLKTGPKFDGDLVSKQGRNELVQHGIAQRVRKFEGGPYDGCMMNELTPDGVKLATAMHGVQSHARN
jgi:hypothetical protein